jgi:hypothetical protein
VRSSGVGVRSKGDLCVCGVERRLQEGLEGRGWRMRVSWDAVGAA